MQGQSITINTDKTIIISEEDGEILTNSSLVVGKEYVVTIQLTKLK